MSKTRKIAIKLLKNTGSETDKESVDAIQKVVLNLSFKVESIFHLVQLWGQKTDEVEKNEIIERLRQEIYYLVYQEGGSPKRRVHNE